MSIRFAAIALFVCGPCLWAGEPVSPLRLKNVVPLPAPVADEPLSKSFSATKAARALDAVALDWVKTKKCAACHSVPPYLLARPALNTIERASPEVREFVERIVSNRLEGEPSLPKDAISAVLVQVAVSLAVNDKATTGKLHPLTREALDRMWTIQRADGGWDWPFRDVPPIKMDEHYGVTLAAIGVGASPDGYMQSEPAQRGLAGIRRYLKSNPPDSLHKKGMLLWASRNVANILTDVERQQFRNELLQAQRPDGGWSLAQLVDNSTSVPPTEMLKTLQSEPGFGVEFLVYAGKSAAYKSSLNSDGYATGFAVYVARQAEIPASDKRLQQGIAWLKGHQRESGRWFSPSQGNHVHNYISNAATAYAVLALDACGAIAPE